MADLHPDIPPPVRIRDLHSHVLDRHPVGPAGRRRLHSSTVTIALGVRPRIARESDARRSNPDGDQLPQLVRRHRHRVPRLRRAGDRIALPTH